jgi:hypothetical protein
VAPIPGVPGLPATAVKLSPSRYLRQLSLDLRGKPPTAAEYAAVETSGKVDPSLIDGMVHSAEFTEQAKRWHSEILWPNLTRYRVKPVGLSASPRDNPQEDPLTKDTELRNVFSPLADPLLWTNEAARQVYGVSYSGEEHAQAFRGGAHAYGATSCDLADKWEYPPESAVGTPKNGYTVDASESGTGQAYTRKFYSEDPDTYGMVLPIYSPDHCPNFCRGTDPKCLPIVDATEGSWDPGSGALDGCYRDMDTPGDDPSGRHELDTPGMRCADGFVREVNRCDFWKSALPKAGNLEIAPGVGELRIQRARSNTPYGHNSYNNQIEGWRWAKHYWSGGKEVKTCALEAQDREFGIIRKDTNGQAVRCDTATSETSYYFFDPSCGCGPLGSYCGPADGAYRSTLETRTEEKLRKSLEQEPIEMIGGVIERDEDYFSILSTQDGVVNGSLAVAWRYTAPLLHGEGFNAVTPPGATDPSLFEKIDYEDNTWHPYTRGPQNSGILTTLGFLIRFPTHRARVAQYRRKFLCSTEFDYAPMPDPKDTNPDISVRSGCKDCHHSLETEGMFFGRYPDRQAEWLDPIRFPLSDPTWQEDFQYRTPEEHLRLDQGPAAMVARDRAGTDLAACTVRTAAKRLLLREPTDAEAAVFLADFTSSKNNYRALVRSIVGSDSYASEELQ